MRLSISWIKYLKKRRGKKVLSQALHMFRLHSTPFSFLLRNIFDALESSKAKFTFPIVAEVARKNPRLTREILSCGHEVAVHGFKHLNYSYLAKQQQDDDIRKALEAFKAMGIQVKGFRAPYNVYTEETPRLVEQHGFLWDIGIGYNPKYWENTSPFRIKIGNHESSYLCIPLNKWSDDLMIDIQNFNSHQMAQKLKHEIKETCEKGGVVMFDLHPIRMGQPKYVDALRSAVKYGTELNGWFPTVTEAVNYWKRHSCWKDGADFSCLLTGDIDNLSFFDYLKRLL